MRSIFDELPPDQVLRSVLSETQEAISILQNMSGFLIDPSAGFLTQHQKDVAYKIYQNADHVAYIMQELEKYYDNISKDSPQE
ncbi:MAG: hypothetical protein KDE51_06465 [Anaerolineales bacterium]|nr:hypothetical protein [Anaerolineales bacterium]